MPSEGSASNCLRNEPHCLETRHPFKPLLQYVFSLETLFFEPSALSPFPAPTSPQGYLPATPQSGGRHGTNVKQRTAAVDQERVAIVCSKRYATGLANRPTPGPVYCLSIEPPYKPISTEWILVYLQPSGLLSRVWI